MKRLKHLIPAGIRSWLRGRRSAAEKELLALDRVRDWGVFRRVEPYRRELGSRRGSCIDRYYIEAFLAENRQHIRGNVAEFESDLYTKRFGQAVEHSAIIDLDERNTSRTLTLDLERTDAAPSARFDCILCTQTLFLVRDYPAAIRTLHRMLKPGGTLLATVPGISPVIRGRLLAGVGEDVWRFTARSAEIAFSESFGAEQVAVRSYGNVLACTAFLHGIVQEELTVEELQFHDPDFELIVAVTAIKAPTA